MPEAELWIRLNRHLGADYAPLWAQTFVIADLGQLTVREALDAGLKCKVIWRAVWAALELPPSEL
ncbi:MAG: DUF3046 domain-containing protein [Propionibacteriaceae bacterium]|jgi:hypothetical protein|nr:DUF3046 domain-containing protein [Propionibacteriaceae bacterium]